MKATISVEYNLEKIHSYSIFFNLLFDVWKPLLITPNGEFVRSSKDSLVYNERVAKILSEENGWIFFQKGERTFGRCREFPFSLFADSLETIFQNNPEEIERSKEIDKRLKVFHEDGAYLDYDVTLYFGERNGELDYFFIRGISDLHHPHRLQEGLDFGFEFSKETSEAFNLSDKVLEISYKLYHPSYDLEDVISGYRHKREMSKLVEKVINETNTLVSSIEEIKVKNLVPLRIAYRASDQEGNRNNVSLQEMNRNLNIYSCSLVEALQKEGFKVW